MSHLVSIVVLPQDSLVSAAPKKDFGQRNILREKENVKLLRPDGKLGLFLTKIIRVPGQAIPFFETSIFISKIWQTSRSDRRAKLGKFAK